MKARTLATLDRWILWGLVALVALLPNWVGLKLTDYAAPTINNNPHLDSGMLFDIFTGQKFILLMVAGGVVLALFAYRTWADRGDLEPSPFHIPLLLMLLGILLALVTSPFPWIALTGVPRHTMLGSLTWVMDLGLFFVALHTAGRVGPGGARSLLWALAPFVVLNGILVTIWFYGTDLMANPAVRDFFYPPGKVKLTGGGALITTLGNQNYASGLGAVVTAAFFLYAMLAREARERWAAVLLAWFGFAMVAGSLSSSGFVTLLVVTPVGLGLAAWLAADRRQALVTCGAALAGFAVVLAVFAAQNPRVWRETAGGVGGLLSATVDGTGSDGSGSAAAAPGGAQANLPPEVQLPPYVETAGTGRVYIWKETVKLALQRPLTGWGMDTLAYTFPQNDPAGGQRQLVVKPHNTYLAVLYGAGFIGFVGFAGLLLVGAWLELRALVARSIDPARAALLAPAAAYLVQGLVNDGMLGMSTLFWVAAGVALGGATGSGAQAGQAGAALSRAAAAGDREQTAEAARPARRDRRRR